MTQVLKPLQPPYEPDVAAALAQYPKAKDGYIIQLFRVFANSRRFLTQKGVVNLLDKGSPLSLTEREIVILRVTAHTRCEYEWGVHVTAFAQAAGLSARQVEATCHPGVDDCWNARQALLVSCVDDICAQAGISSAHYEAFCETWDLEQQLEILALCGNYHTISFVANTVRLAPEESGARFPRAC